MAGKILAEDGSAILGEDGSFIIQEDIATLEVIDPNILAISGQNLVDVFGQIEAITAGTVPITGQDIIPVFAQTESITAGIVLITGQNVVLGIGTTESITAGTVPIAGQDIVAIIGRGTTESITAGIVSIVNGSIPEGLISYLRPISDISVGGWTNEVGGTSLYPSLDETTQNDTDFIKSSNHPSNDVCEVSLTPNAISDGILRVTVGKNTTGGDTTAINITVALMQGVTQIASWSYLNVAEGFSLKTETLTGPQIASITNFSNLRARITANSA